MKTSENGAVANVETLAVAPESRSLYMYLLEKGRIEPIREFDEEQLHVYPLEVLSKIQSGLSDWETMVPRAVAQLIKERKLFGYAA
jgi:hypothetical protein